MRAFFVLLLGVAGANAANAMESLGDSKSALAALDKTLSTSGLNATGDTDPVHELCAAGKFRASIELDCRDCPTGFFQNLVGAGVEVEEKDLRSGCKQCKHGYFQDEAGHQACKECPDGFANSGLIDEDDWLDFGYEVVNSAVRDGDMAANPGDKVGDQISEVTLSECKAACNSDAECNNFAYSFFTRDCQKYSRCLTADEPPAPRFLKTLKECTCKDEWTSGGKTYKGCSHLDTESGYRKMCFTTDNCNFLANRDANNNYFDFCPQDPVWITYHRSCINGGVKRCIKDCQGFKQTGTCDTAAETLVMTPNWDTPDSTSTCSEQIDETQNGHCVCYGYDDDGTKVERNLGHSNCEKKQPFTTCDQLCDLHWTAMWRVTDGCDPNGVRNRMYDQHGVEQIDRYKSGYCQCEDIWKGNTANIMKSTCDPGDKSYKTCKEACDDYWANRYSSPEEAGP